MHAMGKCYHTFNHRPIENKSLVLVCTFSYGVPCYFIVIFGHVSYLDLTIIVYYNEYLHDLPVIIDFVFPFLPLLLSDCVVLLCFCTIRHN